MPIYSFEGLRPVVHATAYVHPTAVLIGDVHISARCYVGPGAALRGDIGRLTLEGGSNVQDNCVLHAFPGAEVVVEVDGHVGHGAILHGCRIGRNALVGMHAVIMDRAVIGEESIVAATSFVKAGFIAEPRTLIVGTPARPLRPVTAEEIEWKSQGTREYQALAQRSLSGLRPCEPLSEAEPGRPRLTGDYKPLLDIKASQR